MAPWEDISTAQLREDISIAHQESRDGPLDAGRPLGRFSGSPRDGSHPRAATSPRTDTPRPGRILMASDPSGTDSHVAISRRTLITGVGLAAGAAVIAPRLARAQGKPMEPPSTITTPPRDFGPGGAPTTYFTDPDVLTIDPMFDDLRQPNAAIQRLWTGALWAEGPAWSGQGKYLVFSDIPNNRQLRWLEDTNQVSVFRLPSNNSNGNTFDFQGRQLSCEHLTRRVVRYENDGSIPILADSFQGKRPNP